MFALCCPASVVCAHALLIAPRACVSCVFTFGQLSTGEVMVGTVEWPELSARAPVYGYSARGDGGPFVGVVGELVLGSSDDLKWVRGLRVSGNRDCGDVTGSWLAVARAPPVIPLKVQLPRHLVGLVDIVAVAVVAVFHDGVAVVIVAPLVADAFVRSLVWLHVNMLCSILRSRHYRGVGLVFYARGSSSCPS